MTDRTPLSGPASRFPTEPVAFLLLLLAVLAAWLPGLGGKPFDDDFLFVFSGLPPEPLYAPLLHKSPLSAHYRPLEAILLKAAQDGLGIPLGACLIGGLAVAAHLLGAWLLYRVLLKTGTPRGAALWGCLALATHPVATSALLGYDSTSQVHATWLGWLALMGTAWGAGQTGFTRWAAFAGSALSLLLALLFKETALGFAAGALGLLAVEGWRRKALAPLAGPALILAAAPLLYLFLRYQAGLTLSGGEVGNRYPVEPGLGTVRNLAQLATAVLTPVSTVSLYEAVAGRQWWTLAPLLAGTAGILGIAGLGALESLPRAIRTAALFLTALFPAFLIRHVSELYAYSALPLLAFLLARGMTQAWASPRLRILTGTAALSLLMLHVQAAWEKGALLKQNGEVAEHLVDQAAALVRPLPPGAAVRLQDHRGRERSYSIYRVRGLAPLTDAARLIAFRAERPDLRIRFAPPSPPLPPDPSAFILEAADPDDPSRGLVLHPPLGAR